MENVLLKLVSPPIEFEFGGDTYLVKKANLEKAILYQEKIKSLSGDPAGDIKLVAYCIYLVLKDVKQDITEDQIIKESPADLDPMEVLTFLGFINPQKLEIAKGLQNKVLEKLTTSASLDSSSKKQDGQ